MKLYYLRLFWKNVKFLYSEKAIKVCEISPIDLFYVVKVKSIVEISQIFVAFSECMNFKTWEKTLCTSCVPKGQLIYKANCQAGLWNRGPLKILSGIKLILIRGITWTHMNLVWNHSDPSEDPFSWKSMPYSANQSLARNFFLCFLQQTGSWNLISDHQIRNASLISKHF